MSCRPLLVLILLTTGSGCAGIGTSRWAMDDEIYASKYDGPYPSNDTEKVARMIKQASDARHVSGREGSYFGSAASTDPATFGAEIGRFHYLNSATSGRFGLKGLVGTGATDWFAGLDVGLRVQAPSRLAPFAGVGAFVGMNGNNVAAEDDGIDNDGNGFIDERGEKENDPKFLASFYPEAGVHYWLNSDVRLTGSAQYHLTTDGRESDFWFIGLSIAFLEDGYVDED